MMQNPPPPVPPSQTLYLNNLNEKVKLEGYFCLLILSQIYVFLLLKNVYKILK